MRKFWEKNRRVFIFVFLVFVIWRLFLFIPYILAEFLIPTRLGFLGEIPWANFDGVHYLSIAQNGYLTYEQAFFPVFPLLIKQLSFFLNNNYLLASLIIVNTSLFLSLFLLYKLVALDFKEVASQWSLLFMLFFPTSFFFASVYSESLFLALVLGSFYAARKSRWGIASLLGIFASATRFIGVFLLPAILWEWFIKYARNKKSKIKYGELITIASIPLGLVLYMVYLWNTYGDPFLFFHSQPAFGANRSGSDIILFPQVIFRYMKIFFSVSPTQYDFWIAVLEVSLLIFIVSILLLNIKKIRVSYTIFSLFAVLIPTLTGTFSSEPRYVLLAFPAYIVFATIKNIKAKLLILCLFIGLLVVLTALFTRGYFVS